MAIPTAMATSARTIIRTRPPSVCNMRALIPVGEGPHGLCVYPQPGRYSLGHTGIFR
ncbi:hypothetical protein ABIA33_002214 [Streptacidiphilus sp. MAP12-16]